MNQKRKLIALLGLAAMGGIGAWLLQTIALASTTSAPSAPPPTASSAPFYTTTIVLPTYPYLPCLQTNYNGPYAYRRLNWSCYGNPNPVPRSYTLLVLENDYLIVTLLPELGGRVYQMIYKPTGSNELYQNPVIKPTHWGPTEQGWWLAAGGIEWCLPVEEHGYEWSEPWSYAVVTSTAGVTVTLWDTTAANRLRAAITVHLPAEQGVLEITPRLENPTPNAIQFKYWTNALLAPGPANSVGPELRFTFNAAEVSIHSTGDSRLPGAWPTPISGPSYRISWPLYKGVDFSRLGNWREWIGFFEYPQAQADFIGVYDAAADEGVARVFPANVAHGVKGFGMGWTNRIDPNTWTDDGSMYVELHGGVAPTFWDAATLAAGQALEWTEIWYPVNGIGALSTATAEAALGVRQSGGNLIIGVHATAFHAASATALHVWDRASCTLLGRWELPAIEPGMPFTVALAAEGRTPSDLTIVYSDRNGEPLATFNANDRLPPEASVKPLPSWVGTTTFRVAWSGEDNCAGIASYDVQARDGYEGTWMDWLTRTEALSATFTGIHGHTYFFRARARDLAGNQTPFGNEEWGETFTTVLTEPAPVLVASRKWAEPAHFPPGQTVAYTVLLRNTGSLTAATALTDAPPAALTMLTPTLAATSGSPPTYAGGLIRWNGDIPPGAQVRVTYVLSPTAATPLGTPLTNTAEITGGISGAVIRRETVIKLYTTWLPLVMRN